MSREQILEAVLDRAAKMRMGEAAFAAFKASHDTHHVAVESDERLIVGDAQHRPRRVPPDAGKLACVVQAARKMTSEIPDDRSGCGVEVSCPPVVAETGPEVEHSLERCARQTPDRGKGPDKAPEVGDRGGHPGLLEHDLRDPDAVRIAILPPRKRTALVSEPAKQRATDPQVFRTLCRSRDCRLLQSSANSAVSIPELFPTASIARISSR